MRNWVIVIAILLCAMTAHAASIDTVVVPADDTPQAGEKTTFFVYFHNAGDKAVRIPVPDSLVGMVKSDGSVFNFTAFSAEPIHDRKILIQPASYQKIAYRFEIPANLKGLIHIEIPEFDDAVMVVTVVDKTEPTAEDDDEIWPPKGETGKYQTLDSMFTLYQPYLGNFGAYQPMFFLVGIDPENSKFQISFKYRFFNPNGSLAANHPWISGFHFAYTQTSFWDLSGDSKPFEDTSYKPELFFQSRNLLVRTTGPRRLFFSTGFQHESNGRGGADSRSTNFLYFQPLFIFYNPASKWGMGIGPKVWAYVGNDNETNPDLPDYRGYFDLQIKAGKANSIVFDGHFGYAQEGGSMELNLTYPLHKILFHNLSLYIQLQYVNALAESLINFRDRTEALRIGFAIVR